MYTVNFYCWLLGLRWSSGSNFVQISTLLHYGLVERVLKLSLPANCRCRCRPVCSVSGAPDYRAGGRGFKASAGPTLSLNKFGESASFAITSANA